MKTKTKLSQSNIIIIYAIILIALFFTASVCSCGKKEPPAQPEPGAIMKKISERLQAQFPAGAPVYENASIDPEIYSNDKNKPADLSKIEKYSIIKAGGNPDIEIAVFKLYDKVNAEYVKEMARTRILNIQADCVSEISNGSEVRSYGNYVYYVSHPQKDKVFEIIEDMLRGA